MRLTVHDHRVLSPARCARNHTPGKLMSARPYYWSWTVVIASTGAGKSIPFIMPLLVDETCRKVVIIISGAFLVHLDHFLKLMYSIFRPNDLRNWVFRRQQSTEKSGLRMTHSIGMPKATVDT